MSRVNGYGPTSGPNYTNDGTPPSGVSHRSEVVLLFEAEDLKRAQAFTESSDLREAMQKAGVVDDLGDLPHDRCRPRGSSTRIMLYRPTPRTNNTIIKLKGTPKSQRTIGTIRKPPCVTISELSYALARRS